MSSGTLPRIVQLHCRIEALERIMSVRCLKEISTAHNVHILERRCRPLNDNESVSVSNTSRTMGGLTPTVTLSLGVDVRGEVNRSRHVMGDLAAQRIYCSAIVWRYIQYHV